MRLKSFCVMTDSNIYLSITESKHSESEPEIEFSSSNAMVHSSSSPQRQIHLHSSEGCSLPLISLYLLHMDLRPARVTYIYWMQSLSQDAAEDAG